jgi:tRNA-Thr(GGU) m(6)t(6)A37 methyltransferase TsaA
MGKSHSAADPSRVWRKAAFLQNMLENQYTIDSIGVIRSTLNDLALAPRQGDEGAPEAWLEINDSVLQGLVGIKVGDEIIVLTWLHLARRDLLQVHPRGKVEKPLMGVFATRSPDRPNPIGLHQVLVLEIAGHRLKVAPLEAVDGTPIIDIKPVLAPLIDQR